MARILPGVWLGLILGTVGVAYALNNPEYLMSWYSIKPTPVNESLLASFCAQLVGATGWFPIAAINQPWNGPAWSISCAVFFYVCLPAILIVLRKMNWLSRILLALLAWGLQAVAIFVVIPLLSPNRAGFLSSQFPLTHITEFLLGVISALVFEHIGMRKKSQTQQESGSCGGPSHF